MQWVFMYEPIAAKLIEHATKIGEPEAVIARARKTLKQPGDSARHDDHIHVRVYCTERDRRYGCGTSARWSCYAEREAEDARGKEITARSRRSSAAPRMRARRRRWRRP